MPAHGYVKRTYNGPHSWENNEAAPFSDVPDMSRGELRLAAEVALAELCAIAVPTWARERAVNALATIARG